MARTSHESGTSGTVHRTPSTVEAKPRPELTVGEFSLALAGLAQIATSERTTDTTRNTADATIEKLSVQNPTAYAEYMRQLASDYEDGAQASEAFLYGRSSEE